jgi:hypothetical protein
MSWKLSDSSYDEIRKKSINDKLLHGDLQSESKDYSDIDFALVRKIQNSGIKMLVDDDLDLLYF